MIHIFWDMDETLLATESGASNLTEELNAQLRKLARLRALSERSSGKLSPVIVERQDFKIRQLITEAAPIRFPDEVRYVYPRPEVYRILHHLSQQRMYYRQYVLSSGRIDYVNESLDAVALSVHFDDIFSSREHKNLRSLVKKGDRAILVDDLPQGTQSTTAKMDMIGPCQFIGVVPWREGADHDLIRVLRDIEYSQS